jgi:hypothetical protein
MTMSSSLYPNLAGSNQHHLNEAKGGKGLTAQETFDIRGIVDTPFQFPILAEIINTNLRNGVSIA